MRIIYLNNILFKDLNLLGINSFIKLRYIWKELLSILMGSSPLMLVNRLKRILRKKNNKEYWNSR